MNKIKFPFMKVLIKTFFLICFLVSCCVMLHAQISLTGVVIDETGDLLPGVNILEKGTNRGVMTDADGRFSLSVPNERSVLIISFIGYIKQELTVGNQRVLNVQLQPDNIQLGEVTVTALGLTRDTKKLGYAVTTIQAAELTKAGTPNFVTALYGKAAGVKIETMQGGSAAGVSINVRGVSSILGTNQPLVVVNGVPVRNGDVGSGGSYEFASFGNEGRVRSNGIVDLNPDDIESLTILKGAAATALYGSEAANGAVIITSKKAREKGVTVSLNATLQSNHIAFTPYIQTKYGPGTQVSSWTPYESETGGFYLNTLNGQQYHSVRYNTNASFGPKYDGSEVLYWDGNRRKYEATTQNPWGEIFRTGFTQTYNVSINHGSDISSTRFAYTYVDEIPNAPNSSYSKNNFQLVGSLKINKHLDLNYTTTFMIQEYHNRAKNTYSMFGGFDNMFQSFVDVPLLRKMYKTSLGYRNVGQGERTLTPNESFPMDWSTFDLATRGVRNLLWELYDQNVYETENRILSSVEPVWKIINGLSLRGRVSTDLTTSRQEGMYNSERPNALYDPSGSYNVVSRRYNILYGDVLLMYEKNITKDFGITANFGWSGRTQNMLNTQIWTNNGLTIENMFTLNVSRDARGNSSQKLEELKTAWLGNVSFSFKDYAFLELSGRQEKSSTLKKGNNTYFYPAASFSFLYTDAFRDAMPSWYDFGKFRFSIGMVGNAPGIYWANERYDAGSQAGFMWNYIPDQLGNDGIRPEKTVEKEVGLESKFFKNRLVLDLSYFHRTISDQFLRSPLAQSGGSSSILLNVGTMVNKGFELALNGTPVLTKDFSWDLRVNLANPTNEIVKLLPGIDNIITTDGGGGGGYIIRADVGRPLGDIWLCRERLSPDGRKIVGANGNYSINTGEREKIANGMPKLIGGIGTAFAYKNFFLDVFTDFRLGGYVISEQRQYMTGRGLTKETLQARDKESGGITFTRSDANGNSITIDKGMILPGVNEIFDDAGNVIGYKENDIIISSDVYFIGRYNWGNATTGGGTYAGSVMENSYWKMREIAFGYRVPSSVSSKIGLRDLTVSVFGRNLFYIYKTIKDFDCESSSGTGWQNSIIIGNSTNPTRSFGCSLRVNF